MLTQEITLTVTVIFVVVFSGLLSLSEAALLSLNKNKFRVYKKENSKKLNIKVVDKILKNKQQYITAIIILNTITNVGGSAIIGSQAALLMSSQDTIKLSTDFLQLSLGLKTLFTICFTFIVLYFSKMIPKLVGSQKPLSTLLFTSIFIYILQIFIKPLIWLSVIICKPFVGNSEDNTISLQEIKTIMKEARKDDIIKDREMNIINNTFSLNNLNVKDIMKYKDEIEQYDASASILESESDILNFKHKRIIITVGEKDEKYPVGVVLVRDLLKGILNKEDKKFSDYAHELLVVKDTDTLSHILADFNDTWNYLALVKNEENGKYLGILAIEDIMDSLTNGFSNS